MKPVIEELKKLNCDLILNTGDNIYNSLAVGFESGIINEKNIFHIDLNKVTKKLIITTFNDLCREKNENMKNDKMTMRNIDKFSTMKNKVQNLITTKKIGGYLKSKIMKNNSREKTEAKDSRRNLENVIDKNNLINSNNSLFKSVKQLDKMVLKNKFLQYLNYSKKTIKKIKIMMLYQIKKSKIVFLI